MSEPDSGPDVHAMLTAARRTTPQSPAVTAQSRLKADLAFHRREMRVFLLAYRNRFGLGPEDENSFLLRYFDSHWKDDDKIKWIWLCCRRLLSREFAIQWDRAEKADMPATHFIACASAGQWSTPEIPPLSEEDRRRLRGAPEIAGDAFLFVITVAGLLICLIAGFIPGPVFGLIWTALCLAAIFYSHRNFRREVRARILP